MKKQEVIDYIKFILEPNKKGVCSKIMEEAERMYPHRFSYVEGEHPFDINYNNREAYYTGLKHAYKDILEKLTPKNEK